MEKGNIDFIVIGDTNMDYHVNGNIPISFSDLLENGIIIWEDIEELPGGSGLNFCRFAKEMGYSSLLLSKVGNDSAGDAIKKWVNSMGIFTIDNFMTDQFLTGKALIMRDQKNIRLLINNKNHANNYLLSEDVENYMINSIKSKVVYISGYSIMSPETDRFKTVNHFINKLSISKTSDYPFIVFDVVPHKIYQKMSFDVFYSITDKVDILISEVSTLRRFWNMGNPDEIINIDIVNETLNTAKKFYKNLILRIGPSGCDEQIIWKSESGIIAHEETGHSQVQDKRGFGDKIAITALKNYFNIDNR
jgi:sugar/nucleoside kinase (ribokinase family)